MQIHIMSDPISKIELDALSEIANIAAESANTSFSKILNKDVAISSAMTRLMSLDEFRSILTKPQIVQAICSELGEDLQGHTLFLFPYDETIELINLAFHKYRLSSTNHLDKFAEAAVIEISNIYSGNYINAFAQILGLNISRSFPVMGKDSSSHILDYVFESTLRKSNAGLESRLICFQSMIDVKDSGFKGLFIFLPAQDSSRKIIMKIDTMISQMQVA